MGAKKPGEKNLPKALTVRDVGRAYLHTAIDQNDEAIILRALRDIIDSFLEELEMETTDEFNCSQKPVEGTIQFQT